MLLIQKITPSFILFAWYHVGSLGIRYLITTFNFVVDHLVVNGFISISNIKAFVLLDSFLLWCTGLNRI